METPERHNSNAKVSQFIKFQVSIKENKTFLKLQNIGVTMLPTFFIRSTFKLPPSIEQIMPKVSSCLGLGWASWLSLIINRIREL